MNMHRRHYEDFKDSQQMIMDKFLEGNAFFAFSDSQFQDGLEKLDVTVDEITPVCGGGFIVSSRMDEFKGVLKTLSDNLEEFLKNEDNFLAAMLYEFANYGLEYNGIGYVLENAFCLTPKDLSKTQRMLVNEAVEMYREQMTANECREMDEDDRKGYLEIYLSNYPDEKDMIRHMIDDQGCSEYEAVRWSYSCMVEEIGGRLGMDDEDIAGFSDALLSFDELCNVDYGNVEREMMEYAEAEE